MLRLPTRGDDIPAPALQITLRPLTAALAVAMAMELRIGLEALLTPEKVNGPQVSPSRGGSWGTKQSGTPVTSQRVIRLPELSWTQVMAM